MEPDNHENEALRRGIVFPPELAALKPQIYDDEQSAVNGALLWYFKRPVAPDEFGMINRQPVPEIDAFLLFWFGDPVGMVVHHVSNVAGQPGSYIFYPSPEDEEGDDEQ